MSHQSVQHIIRVTKTKIRQISSRGGGGGVTNFFLIDLLSNTWVPKYLIKYRHNACQIWNRSVYPITGMIALHTHIIMFMFLRVRKQMLNFQTSLTIFSTITTSEIHTGDSFFLLVPPMISITLQKGNNKNWGLNWLKRGKGKSHNTQRSLWTLSL